MMLRAVTTGEGWDKVEESGRWKARQRIQALPEAGREAITDVDIRMDTIIREQMNPTQSPWYNKCFVDFDPTPVLARLSIPGMAYIASLTPKFRRS